MAVDALYRQFEEGSLFVLSLPVARWLDEARQEWMSKDTVRQLITWLQEDLNPLPRYIWHQNTLYKECIFLTSDLVLKQQILEESHLLPIVGLSTFRKSMNVLSTHSFGKA